MDIVKKLRYFRTVTGEIQNLYNSEYSYYDELSKLFNNYIKNEESDVDEYNGRIRLNEIGKDAEYILPFTNSKSPLFVIRMK